jgi:hypothetical protein
MKRFLIAGALSALCAVAPEAQMPKYGVTVTVEKNVDYASFKTYSWQRGQPALLRAVDGQIVAAIDAELAALGMSKAASGPADVLATYYSLTRTDVNLKAKPDEKGVLPESSVGTLVFALLEPGSGRRLLRLRADKPIDTEPAKLEAAIRAVVAELFAQYPTRRKE